MKTLYCLEPGKFEYRDEPIPTPRDGEVLIKLKRVGICGTDYHAFEGTQPFLEYPRIFGHEVSAEIADANGAPGFSNGNLVTIIPYFHCGSCVACRAGKTNCCASLRVFGVHVDGGFREYVTAPASSLVPSTGLDPDSLALAEPLAIGAHGVARAALREGEPTLIVGAGPIGIATILCAKLAGAIPIVMDVNAARLEFCERVLGVSLIINPNSDNASRLLAQKTSGDMPTAVIDVTGNLAAINNAFNYIAHGGRYILIGLQKGEISLSHPEFHKREATLMSSRNATRADFNLVLQTLADGLVPVRDLITHRLGFGDVAARFPGLMKPSSMVVKAMIGFS